MRCHKLASGDTCATGAGDVLYCLELQCVRVNKNNVFAPAEARVNIGVKTISSGSNS
jgi:hypothetical protein